MGISGCEYHGPMLMIKFNIKIDKIQYVGVASCSFDNVLIMQIIRGKR
jgi:hypothetical protein